MRSVAFEAGRDRSTWLSRFLDRRPGWVDRLNEELRKRVAEAADATGTSGRIRRWGWSALLFLASWLRRRALLVFGALIMAVVIAVVAANAEPRYFQVDRNVYVAVAGLFIAALAVERFTELTVAPWVGRGDRAVDRSILVGSAGLVFGVALAAMIGLDGLEVLAQIGQEETSTVGRDDAAVTRTIGLLVAGLAIAGGTKPLHDLISRLERNVQDEQKAAADKKSDETPPSGAGTRRYPIGLDIEVPKWRSLAKKPVDLDDAPAAEPGAQPTGDQDDQPTEAQIAAANATMEEVLKILPGWELSDSRDGTVRALAYVDVSPGTAEHRRQSFTAAHRVQSQRGLQVTAVSVPPEGPLEGEENPPPRWALEALHLSASMYAGAAATDQVRPVRVAVLDTGVNQHAHGVAEDRIKVREDVLAQQSTAPGELAGVVTGTEGELVGKVANWIFDGFDFDPMSSASHATAVASVIAAGGDEELRKQNVDEWWSKSKMVGVAPDAEIISVRVMEGPVHIGDNDVDDGIKKAVEHDADVISMSLGGFGFKGLRQEIDDAVEKGKIVVCATGNAFNVVVEPASYGTTIGVTSFDSDRKPFEEQASRGPSADVAAPGHLVHRATFTGADDVQEVEPSTGTTYATAHVAGVAALWLGKHGVENLRTFYPKIKLPQLFKHALKATTDPWDDRDLQADWGTGRVNVKKLLDFEIFKRDANGQPIGAAVADDALNKAFVEIDFLAPQDQVLGGIAAVFTGKGTVNTREGLVGAAQSIPGLLAAEVASSPPSDEQFRKGVATGNPADLPVPAGASSELQTVIAEASDDGRRAAELKLNTTPLNPEWGAGLSKPLRRALEGRADPVKGRRWWGVVALVVAILVALLAGEARDFLGRAAGISGLLAFLTVGVYAFAQGIERLLEWTLARAVYRDVPGREPDRALILLGAGVLLGTVGSVVLDIGLLASVGDLTDAAGMQLTEGTGADKMEVGSDPLFERADALVTGLAVGGGAKPIHDLLTRIRLPLGT